MWVVCQDCSHEFHFFAEDKKEEPQCDWCNGNRILTLEVEEETVNYDALLSQLHEEDNIREIERLLEKQYMEWFCIPNK